MKSMLTIALVLSLAVASNALCQCAFTSGNQGSCCADHNAAGKDTGAFCGNWFTSHTCGGDTPLCCTSDGTSACCPAGSSCTPACAFGMTGCGCMANPPASEASRRFNLTVALAFASLTQASMCGPVDALQSWSCSACASIGFDVVPGSMSFVTKSELGDNTTFAYIARLSFKDSAAINVLGSTADAKDNSCVVAIRGTKNLQNGLADASFWTTKVELPGCEDCSIHSGFAHEWDVLKNSTKDALRQKNCSNVYVTGHSMGASVAQLAMYDLQTSGFSVQQSHHFEAARLGNSAFVSAFQAAFGNTIPAFRITHAYDPVPHLPPQGLLGYRHAGPEAYLFPTNSTMEHVVCATGEDPLCANRYNILDTSPHGDDHCNTPLVESGNICNCPL